MAQGLYDEPIRHSYVALAELKPARYARQEMEATVAEGPSAEAATPPGTSGGIAVDQSTERVFEAGSGAPVLTGIGLEHRRAGRFDMAEQAYRSALDADPAYGPAILNLGVLLDLYLQRPVAALGFYESYQATLAEPDPRVAAWISVVAIRPARDTERTGEGP